MPLFFYSFFRFSHAMTPIIILLTIVERICVKNNMVEVQRTYNMQKYKILKQIVQNMSYKKEFFKDLSKCDYIFLHCKYKGKHKLFL